ncbi:LOW QUALITY PROTEIN: hypothetical protein PanWU01x14_326990 [Parasponia andersonii]|uniref:Uncharacterized protein n=1 Tax=Parasponia andersonii TaxID=3476 RepID=A0A2P5AJA2_PARAD|nr:LOW QUALITY PROTEIN: hypothetical protein PanWU01x14_326990 [Parasponia andersonii]
MAANKISEWRKKLMRTDIIEQLENCRKLSKKKHRSSARAERLSSTTAVGMHFRNECHYMEPPPLEMNVEEDDVKRKKRYGVEEVRTEHLQHILLPFFRRAAN